MYYLYFLYSASAGKYYIGQTGDVQARLSYHNSVDNRIWTKRGQPWELVAYFEFPDRGAAMVAERFVKKQKSVSTIERIIREGYLLGGKLLPNLTKGI